MPRKRIQNNANEMTNYYESPDVIEHQQDYVNPTYNEQNQPFKHPFQSILCGQTGSGKSNILINIIQKTNGTFNFIKIFTQNKHEPLYLMLEKKIPKPFLEIFEGIDAFNKINFEKLEKGQYLFIYDDMCVESAKKQKQIEELYIRGRKMGGNGISNIYLSQSYYDIPMIIRKQCSMLILKKINGKKEINAILRDCACGDMTSQTLQNMYNYCVQSKDDICNCMTINKGAPEDRRLLKNFSNILNPQDF